MKRNYDWNYAYLEISLPFNVRFQKQNTQLENEAKKLTTKLDNDKKEIKRLESEKGRLEMQIDRARREASRQATQDRQTRR